MKKKLLIGAALLAILTGCGQQPELDVSADQNTTVQPKSKVIEQNNTKVEQNTTTDTEEDLIDTTAVNVTDESNDINNNQKIAAILSKDVVHFDFDKYNIRPDQMPIVKEVANTLKDIKGNYTVRIEGNCDEWGSDEYNYALGLKRAKTVKNALVDLGVDENKLTIISYGESNPVCTAHNKECWAKNRRDDFTLLP
jgi:peptidoglycan-associated lipoprotein